MPSDATPPTDLDESERREIVSYVAATVNAEIDAGEHACPACGFTVGRINTVSCSRCGHVPEEHRA